MKKRKSIILAIIFIVCIMNSVSAINDFTMTLDSVAQKCEGDGSLIIKVANSEPSAVFEFLVYRLNDYDIYAYTRYSTDSIDSGSILNDTISALNAGEYRIIAYQWAPDGAYNCDTAYAVVVDSSEALDIRLYIYDEDYDCNYTAINARVYDGIGPFTYELINASTNNIVLTKTTENDVVLFYQSGGIASGDYYVRISDACGNIENTATYTHDSAAGAVTYNISNQAYRNTISGCDSVVLSMNIGVSSSALNVFPVEFTIAVTTTSSGTSTQTYYYDDYNGNGYGNWDRDIKMVSDFDEQHTLVCNLVDACGNTASSTIYITPSLTFTSSVNDATCGGKYIRNYSTKYLGFPYTVEFTNAPAAFISNISTYIEDWTNGSYSHTYTTGIVGTVPNFGDEDIPLPEGTYEFTVTNCDGTDSYSLSRTVSNDYDKTIYLRQDESCAIGTGDLQVYYSEAEILVEKVYIQSAPPAFTSMYSVASYPFDASTVWPTTDTERQDLDGVPAGTYEVYTTDLCTGQQSSNTETLTIIAGDTSNFSASIVQTCDGIDVTAGITTTLSRPRLCIQKYNSEDDSWEGADGSGSYDRIASSSTYNFTSKTISGSESFLTNEPEGMYRIYIESGGADICFYIDTFYITDEYSIALNDYYVAQCSNSDINLMIDASGYEPLNYMITAINGVATSIDNGTSPVFTGLNPGTEYSVQITNNCGDAKTFSCSTNFLRSPTIKPSNLCVGSVGQLYIKGLAFMNIRWYKGDPTSTLLKTGNALEFNTFTMSDVDTYYAVMSYDPNTSDCMDDTLYFEIDTNHITSAGVGRDTIISKNVATAFSLFDLLTGPYDEYGDWEELTTENMINGEYLLASNLPVGSYEFMYAVEDGYCGSDDTTYVTVHIVNEKVNAVTDSFEVCPGVYNTNIGNVMDNDTNLLGAAITQSYFTVTDLSNISEIVILPNGNITVTSNTESDSTYVVKYKVEDISQSDNYDIDSVVIQVYSAISSGSDTTVLVLVGSGTMTLFDYLGGSPDVGGVWWNEGYSSTFTGLFDIPDAKGDFYFHYLVENGICGNDTTTLTINVRNAPGGVSDNLQLWVRADEGYSATYWIDFNNGKTCTPVGSPSLNTGSHNYNPGVIFDGSNDYIEVYDGFSDFTVGLESFVVAMPTDTVTSALFYDLDADIELGFRSETNMFSSTNGVGYESTTGLIDYSQDNIYGLGFDGSVASSNGSIYKGGRSMSTNSYSAPSVVLRTDNTIGIGSSYTNGFIGDIPEVVIYNRNLSDIERRRVDSYLAVKYGLTLSDNNNGAGSSLEIMDGAIAEGDYLMSDSTVIWDATTYSGYNNAVFGIGTDSTSLLVQKVSRSISDTTLTIAYNADFTSLNDASGRTALADSTFIMVGHNGVDSLFGSAYYGKRAHRMNRVWVAEVTGAPDSVFVAVSGTFDFPRGIPVVIVSTDNDHIESSDLAIILTEANGYYYAKIPITQDVDFYFTFGAMDNYEYMRHGKHFDEKGKEREMTF